MYRGSNYNQEKIKTALTNLKPEDMSIMIQILSGHNNLNYHLMNTLQSYTPLCKHCVDPKTDPYDIYSPQETATHIITECPAFAKTRNEIYYSHQITTQHIFNNYKIKTAFDKLLKFAKKN